MSKYVPTTATVIATYAAAPFEIDVPDSKLGETVRDRERAALRWLSAELAAAYRRGLETSLEILGAEATSASYHGWKSADEEFMKLHKKIRQEIQHPMLDRMTGNPKAEGRYDDEQ